MKRQDHTSDSIAGRALSFEWRREFPTAQCELEIEISQLYKILEESIPPMYSGRTLALNCAASQSKAEKMSKARSIRELNLDF